MLVKSGLSYGTKCMFLFTLFSTSVGDACVNRGENIIQIKVSYRHLNAWKFYKFIPSSPLFLYSYNYMAVSGLAQSVQL